MSQNNENTMPGKTQSKDTNQSQFEELMAKLKKPMPEFFMISAVFAMLFENFVLFMAALAVSSIH